jgi:hypothetical protein
LTEQSHQEPLPDSPIEETENTVTPLEEEGPLHSVELESLPQMDEGSVEEISIERPVSPQAEQTEARYSPVEEPTMSPPELLEDVVPETQTPE